MDARGTRYGSLKEFLLYCYRVAGTVGLMMSHVMGLRDESALKHAADLGIAMQLTNIARDITEDAAMGRIYLPLSWLQEAQIPLRRHRCTRAPGKAGYVVASFASRSRPLLPLRGRGFVVSFVSVRLRGRGGAACLR